MKTGNPIVLLVHIPMYVPGRPIGYGCGHPDWAASFDEIHEIEKREPWPKEGHSQVTMDFHREVFTAPNLLGIFAGHVHRETLDVLNGTPQFLSAPMLQGLTWKWSLIPYL